MKQVGAENGTVNVLHVAFRGRRVRLYQVQLVLNRLVAVAGEGPELRRIVLGLVRSDLLRLL